MNYHIDKLHSQIIRGVEVHDISLAAFDALVERRRDIVLGTSGFRKSHVRSYEYDRYVLVRGLSYYNFESMPDDGMMIDAYLPCYSIEGVWNMLIDYMALSLDTIYEYERYEIWHILPQTCEEEELDAYQQMKATLDDADALDYFALVV